MGSRWNLICVTYGDPRDHMDLYCEGYGFSIFYGFFEMPTDVLVNRRDGASLPAHSPLGAAGGMGHLEPFPLGDRPNAETGFLSN